MSELMGTVLILLIMMLITVWFASLMPTNKELAEMIAGPYEPTPIYDNPETGEERIAHDLMVETLADYWNLPEYHYEPVGRAWKEGYCEYCGKGKTSWACKPFENKMQERTQESIRRWGESFCGNCASIIEERTIVEEVGDISMEFDADDIPVSMPDEDDIEKYESWKPCLCRFEDEPELFIFPMHPEREPISQDELLKKPEKEPFEGIDQTAFERKFNIDNE